MTYGNGCGFNTLVIWTYRDASNHKVSRGRVLAGLIDEAERAEIHKLLDDGLFFIPGQVGLEDLQDSFRGAEGLWDPERDHPFHTLTEIRATKNSADPHPSAKSFLEAMRKAAAAGWDENYKPRFYKTMKKRFLASADE